MFSFTPFRFRIDQCIHYKVVAHSEGVRTLLGAPGHTTRNKCIATRSKGLTTRNKKLVETIYK